MTLTKSLPLNNLIKRVEKFHDKISLQEWSKIATDFDKIYPDYFDKSKAAGFNYTNREKRYLILMHLRFSNTEIAQYFGVLPKTIYTFRYRMRKKHDIPKDVSLEKHLQGDITNYFFKTAP